MADIFRTIIVPAAEQAEAQAIAAEYPGGAGMFDGMLSDGRGSGDRLHLFRVYGRGHR